MRELYVYYKVAAADEASAREVVERAQRQLMRQYPGLVARLLTRPSSGADMRTWMEVYAMSDDAGSAGIDAVVEQAIESAAAPLRSYLQGPRHVEVFIACA